MKVDLERNIQKKITKYLKDNNYFYFKINSASINGIPDIFCIIRGNPLFIEVKRENGRLSKLQEYQIQMIRSQGVKVWVVYSYDQFKEFINNI